MSDHLSTGIQIYEGPTIWDRDFYLVGKDPQTGVRVWCRENPDGSITMRHDTPIDATIERAAEMEKESHGKRFGDWRPLASVPDAIALDLGLDKAVEQRDNKYLSKVFNDPDLKKFRTSRGRV